MFKIHAGDLICSKCVRKMPDLALFGACSKSLLSITTANGVTSSPKEQGKSYREARDSC